MLLFREYLAVAFFIAIFGVLVAASLITKDRVDPEIELYFSLN